MQCHLESTGQFPSQDSDGASLISQESPVPDILDKISQRVVGPVPVDLFRTFLPLSQGHCAAHNGTVAYEELVPLLKAAKVESDMYEPLVDYFTKLCPTELKFCNKLKDDQGKPDIIVYANENNIEAMFEVKYNDLEDPFDDNMNGFLGTSNEGSKTLGQITNYATCHQAIELRTHIFSALIFRTYMRLLRWDRSGVVVTEKVSFDNRYLFDFFHRFFLATPAERGRDSTVTATDLSPSERKDIWDSLECDEEARLLTISVGDKKYIILKDQHPDSTSPIGCSTRCFKAYCLQNNVVVMLKDSWRVVSTILKPEHEIYTRLHEHKVQNILEVYGGADVGDDNDPYHTTQTKLWLDKAAKPLELALRTYRHYRIVLEYLPFTLKQLDVIGEMVTVRQDALIAHGQAATMAKVLHRDTNSSDIMFKRNKDGTVQGYLINWDLSLDLGLPGENSDEAWPERMGTWQFLPIRFSQVNDAEPMIPTRIDDIEAFYHLILWMALRYTGHALHSEWLTIELHRNFDARYRDETGRPFFGIARSMNIDSSAFIRKARFANAGIVSVLENMRQVLCERYTQPQFASSAYIIDDNDDSSRKSRLRMAEEDKKLALETLDTPYWLPTLLDQLLYTRRIDWKANEGCVKHELVKVSKFVPSIRKRKTESHLNSKGSRKSSRKSGQLTPQDNRSGPN